MAHKAPEPIRLPDDAWTNPEVQRLCAETDAIGLIRYLKSRYAITQGRLAHWMGIDTPTMSRLLNDTGRVVRLDRWRQLADALNMPAANRLMVLGVTDVERHVGPADPARRRPATVPLPARSAPMLTPGISQTALSRAAEESAMFGQWAESANNGRFSVDQLAAEIRSLSAAYLSGPPASVFRGARAVRDRASTLLQGHVAPGRSRDLYLLAGYACTLLAWISGDLGQLGAADTHGRTAGLCADLADSDELRAWVLSTQSKTAYWDGRLHEAADLAQAGLRLGVSTSVAVLLAAQAADAAAELGRASDARSLLHDADNARGRIAAADAVGGLLSCGPGRQGNYSAGVFVRIGDLDAALRETDAALAAFQRGDVRADGTEMQIHISRALSHLQRGGLDSAIEALGSVVNAPSVQRLTTVADRLGQVAVTLEDTRYARSRPAIAMRQAIADYRAESAAQMLPPAAEERDE